MGNKTIIYTQVNRSPLRTTKCQVIVHLLWFLLWRCFLSMSLQDTAAQETRSTSIVPLLCISENSHWFILASKPTSNGELLNWSSFCFLDAVVLSILSWFSQAKTTIQIYGTPCSLRMKPWWFFEICAKTNFYGSSWLTPVVSYLDYKQR